MPVYWLKIAAVFLLALTIGGIGLYYHYENESVHFVLVEHIEPTGSHSLIKCPMAAGYGSMPEAGLVMMCFWHKAPENDTFEKLLK